MSHHVRRPKRLLAGFLASVLAISFLPVFGMSGVASAQEVADPIGEGNFCQDVPQNEEFDDVNGPDDEGADDPSIEEIICLVVTGITTGTDAAGTTFEPNSFVTRRQMALFLTRTASEANRLEIEGSLEELPEPGTNEFDDVEAEEQFIQNAISQIAQAEVAQGYPDGTYRPATEVTRRQMALFIDRLYTYLTGAELPAGEVDHFEDDDADDPATEEAINSVAEAGIFIGNEDGTFGPNHTITRRQMANVLTRTLQVLYENGYITQWVAGPGSISGTVTAASDGGPTGDGTFTMFVESGGLIFGLDDAEPYVVDFAECPGGVPTDPTRECIELAGTVDDAGNVTIQPGDVSFPEVVTQSDSPIGVVDVRATTSASDVITGTIDPATGAVVLEMPLQIVIDALDDGNPDCRVAFDMVATSGTGDGAPLADDRFTVADETYAIPVAEELPGGLGALACDNVNAQLNLPSPSGENVGVFDVFMQENLTAPADTPIEGATVTAVDSDGTEHTDTTDANGDYDIGGLEAGDYDVTAQAEGYLSETQTGVTVALGSETVVDFALEEGEDPSPTVDVTGDEVAAAGEFADYQLHVQDTGADVIDEKIDIVWAVYDAQGEVVEDAVVEWQFFTFWTPQFIRGQNYADTTIQFRAKYPDAGAYTLEFEVIGSTSGNLYATDSIVTTVPDPVAATSLELSPAEASSVIGDEHEVTATLGHDGDPLAGFTDTQVRFEVYPADGGERIDGAIVSVADGAATFAYTSTEAREDVIVSCTGSAPCTSPANTLVYDDLSQEYLNVTGDPSDTATVSWVLFAPSEFTMFVEGGQVVIGQDADSPYVINFSECPGGVAADPERGCITFQGVIDEAGNFTIQPEDVTFPVLETVADTAFGPIPVRATTSTSGPITGTIDPSTGVASMSLPMVVDVDILADGVDDCRISVGLAGTTGTSGALSGSPLTDDLLSVVDGEFAVPATTPIEGGVAGLCPIVDSTVNAPSPSGQNTAVFNLLFV